VNTHKQQKTTKSADKIRFYKLHFHVSAQISGSALTLYCFISTISHTFLKKEVQE